MQVKSLFFHVVVARKFYAYNQFIISKTTFVEIHNSSDSLPHEKSSNNIPSIKTYPLSIQNADPNYMCLYYHQQASVQLK